MMGVQRRGRAPQDDAATGRRAAAARSLGVGAVAALLLFGGLPGSASTAATTPGVAIKSVDGQEVVRGQVPRPVSGAVDVSGTAAVKGSTPAAPPLVADAGDSGFVAVGEVAVLQGMGFGGAAPYTFAWSASQGTVKDADMATAQFDTKGLQPGTYTVSLTITDRVGETAADTVMVVVYELRQATLVDETRQDAIPGVTGVAPLKLTFEVAAGTARLDAKLTWENELNDYDLYLYDPDGKQAASSAGGVPQTSEATGVSNPAAGAWTLEADRFLTATDTLTVRVTAEVGIPDPRPSVSSGGPYAFPLGTAQKLDASVTGGSAPVSVGWDLDEDGTFDDVSGTNPAVSLPEGRHLVTVKATDAAGLERRETTSVQVADAAVIATRTSPVTVIGIADTGINAYHQEFSAATYPDPAILALTGNFTKHPSEYIPGYPKDAKAIPITHGKGYFPAEDKPLWDGNTTVKVGALYWIPGTKIVGAVATEASTGATSGSNPHPILDDNGHGSGSASVSAGNRYGYCPTCLLVVVEGLTAEVATTFPWVDITSHSYGYVGGAPFGVLPLFPKSDEITKAAAERGQTVLFAAGNGIGNAFDVPIVTWHSDNTGPDWNITVGAIRRDNQRAVVGDGIPVHLSSWGDGNLPSACGKGTVGQCAFSGTSAATPYTAGVFGTVLTQVRAAVGDGSAGQKPGQVVAKGIARPESVYLADGELTRAELREAVLKTAYPLNQGNATSPFPYPLTAPYLGEPNVLFEGYGAATPESAKRAVDVLLGRAQLPERPFEDDFFALDRSIRDSVWEGYDRDGDGTSDYEGFDSELAGELGLTQSLITNVDTVKETLAVLRKAALATTSEPLLAPMGENSLDYYLHRRVADVPGAPTGCSAALPTADVAGNEQYMDRADSAGDLEPCFENRITSVAAAYRPLGIFASADTLDAPLPSGSTVNVELYLAGETPSMISPSGVLVATDREIGKGAAPTPLPVVGSGPDGAACSTLGEACWTKYQFTFTTTRPAFTGEQLTFQVQLLGARSWAFGHEGTHASKISIDPADMPGTGLEFGASITSPADGSSLAESETVTAGGSYAFPDLGSDPTGAGDHPVTRKVEVSVDDASFADPLVAVLDEESKTWSVKVGTLPVGEHAIYARARIDQTVSEVTTSRFTVRPDTEVQWQIVSQNAAAAAKEWQTTDDLVTNGAVDWSFTLETADHGTGPKTIVVRLVHHGVEITRDTARVRFR